MIFRFLAALALLAPGWSSAAPQVLLDAATGPPEGFAPPPAVATDQGATAWRGPAEWKIPPRDGIFTLTFRRSSGCRRCWNPRNAGHLSRID